MLSMKVPCHLATKWLLSGMDHHIFVFLAKPRNAMAPCENRPRRLVKLGP